jgi:hypothetical protein
MGSTALLQSLLQMCAEPSAMHWFSILTLRHLCTWLPRRCDETVTFVTVVTVAWLHIWPCTMAVLAYLRTYWTWYHALCIAEVWYTCHMYFTMPTNSCMTAHCFRALLYTIHCIFHTATTAESHVWAAVLCTEWWWCWWYDEITITQAQKERHY